MAKGTGKPNPFAKGGTATPVKGGKGGKGGGGCKGK